jgi:putative transposase
MTHFSHDSPKDRNKRDLLINKAHIDCGYTLKEIADLLHVHYATVSRAVKRGEKKNV